MTIDPKFRTAGQVSDHLEGEIIGDPDLLINNLASIEADQANSLTFFGHPRYEQYVYGNRPRAILVPQNFVPRQTGHITFIRVKDVYEALSRISHGFQGSMDEHVGISFTSTIHDSVRLGADVSIGHYSVVEDHVTIGENSRIGNQVTIGRNASIGSGCIIHDGVKIYGGIVIGNRCVIHSNAIIGGEGFGFAPTESGFQRIHHQGSVIIEDDVEIGCNTCIDRGAMGDTVIKKGVKLDNLIQVGHGVVIEENVAIAAQSGVSGSSTIGKNSIVGGQVGIAGHVSIAPGSKIQAKSGVASDINRPGKKWYGYPVLSYFGYLRSFVLFKRLPELFDRIKRLEEK